MSEGADTLTLRGLPRPPAGGQARKGQAMYPQPYPLYSCLNVYCLDQFHATPICPRVPQPQPVYQGLTDAERRAFQHLRHLERTTDFRMPEPLDLRWMLLIPLAVVAFILLALLA